MRLQWTCDEQNTQFVKHWVLSKILLCSVTRSSSATLPYRKIDWTTGEENGCQNYQHNKHRDNGKGNTHRQFHFYTFHQNSKPNSSVECKRYFFSEKKEDIKRHNWIVTDTGKSQNGVRQWKKHTAHFHSFWMRRKLTFFLSSFYLFGFSITKCNSFNLI